MKKTYIISLFAAVVILSLAYYGSYRYAISDIGKNPIENTADDNKNIQNNENEKAKSLTVDNDEDKITSSTEYVLELYDANSYSLTEEKLAMPVTFIGMDRESLINYIKEYETNPSLEDIENGFVYIELVSFSDDSITIRKTYKPEKLSDQYYMVVENGYVTVYYSDRKTVYTYTDISLSSLPEEVQQEIIDGKQITSLQDLYNFLETYTS